MIGVTHKLPGFGDKHLKKGDKKDAHKNIFSKYVVHSRQKNFNIFFKIKLILMIPHGPC